jgi:hypothetical protein
MAQRNEGIGPAAAALLAAGIGSAAMGIVTTVSEATHGMGGAMAWVSEVGPLSGKSSIAVLIWLVAWLVLHAALARRSPRLRTVSMWTYVLVAIGFLGTFPPVFRLFE